MVLMLHASIISATLRLPGGSHRPDSERIAGPAPPATRGQPTYVSPERELYVGEVRDAAMPCGLKCPRCGSEKIVRYGKRNGAQRYMCKLCRRTFTDFTGTVLHGLRRRELWLEFCKCLMEGLTVREAARRLGISKNTSFAWRHRAIAALASADSSQKCQGIVELAQLPMLRSFKGCSVPVEAEMQDVKPTFRRHHFVYSRFLPRVRVISMVVAVDRAGRARAVVAPRGENLTPTLSELIVRDAQVCAPVFGSRFRFGAGWPGGLNWVGAHGGRRRIVGRVAGGPLYHVRNANRLIHYFVEWMRRFCGVATKYLLRYFSWYLRRMALTAAGPTVAAKLLLLEVLSAGAGAVPQRH